VPILVQACGALEEAHRMGIVHRDLKPANIFLCQQGTLTDYPKVLDFGLAKVTEQQMRPGSIILTQEGMVFGTPEFMSPEQAQGRTLDARSDIYSLAVILYEVLTGKLPFTAKTPMEYIQKHVMEEAVLAKALAKRPEDRYQSAAEFADALRPFGVAEGALPYSPTSGPYLPSTPGPAAVQPIAGAALAPPAAAAKRPGTGLLIGVAALCLVLGVLLAVLYMRVMQR
jgi:serine/threonine-protein kinase